MIIISNFEEYRDVNADGMTGSRVRGSREGRLAAGGIRGRGRNSLLQTLTACLGSRTPFGIVTKVDTI